MAIKPVHRPGTVIEHLSPRELEVLQAIADGHSNRSMSAAMHISEETVKTHVRHILEKLVAPTRSAAVALGFRRGIIV